MISGTLIAHKVKCPFYKAFRVIEVDSEYEGFAEVPCLVCRNNDNPVFLSGGRVFYEDREANIKSGFRRAK